MKSRRCAAGWVFALSGFVAFSQAASARVVTTPASRTSDPVQELRARCDPGLESMRAGRVRESDRLTIDDRANLLAAQERSAELLDMRAGGAVEVLLIVALVLLILVLI
jgi:hypothetical protein